MSDTHECLLCYLPTKTVLCVLCSKKYRQRILLALQVDDEDEEEDEEG